jgi:hypothetical protein
VFRDKFVLEHIIREFLLLVLLLYQLLVATSGAGDGLESDLPQVKSTAAGNPLINLGSNMRNTDKTLVVKRQNSNETETIESPEPSFRKRMDEVHKVMVQTQPST